MLPVSAIGAPGVHGATVTGVQVPGVSTPNAAAVWAAVIGLARLVHSPNGRTLANGLLSMIVATGMFSTRVRFSGVTMSVLGANPNAAHRHRPVDHREAGHRPDDSPCPIGGLILQQDRGVRTEVLRLQQPAQLRGTRGRRRGRAGPCRSAAAGGGEERRLRARRCGSRRRSARTASASHARSTSVRAAPSAAGCAPRSQRARRAPGTANSTRTWIRRRNASSMFFSKFVAMHDQAVVALEPLQQVRHLDVGVAVAGVA